MHQLARGVAISLTFALLTGGPAYAGAPKAWTAAAKAMPADSSAVIAVDLAAVSKTATFEHGFTLAVGKSPPLKAGMEKLKDICKLDPLTIVRSIVVGFDASHTDVGMFVHVANFTPAKLATCMKQQFAAAMADDAGAAGKSEKGPVPEISVKTDHGITDVSGDGKHLYVGWIGSDVMVIVPMHMENREALAAWMGGGGFGKGALGKLTGKLNTSAAIFGASAVGTDIDAKHKLVSGSGSMMIAKADLVFEMHGDVGDAASATSVAATATDQIDGMRKNPPLPALTGLLSRVTVAPVGNELVLKASMVDKDLADLIGLALMSLGN